MKILGKIEIYYMISEGLYLQTLLSFINEAFQTYVGYHGMYKEVQDFIGNNEKCLSLIYNLLDIGVDDVNVLNKKNFDRASHILITFLLGVGINRKNNIISGSNKFNDLPDEYLWMVVALLHDYGYLRKELSHKKSLEEFEFEYDLLSDKYDAIQLKCLNDYSLRFPEECTFSYDTIKKYYNYRKDNGFIYDFNENDEFNDHGILGACLAFNQYIRFYVKDEYYRHTTNTKKIIETEPLLYKTACIIAAQHNMYKSNDEKTDYIYREYELDNLISTAPIMINSRNSMLLLLSIVDTIECTKRFSKKRNHRKYLETMTILNNITIEVTPIMIKLDFTNLNYYIIEKRNSSEMKEQLMKHINGVLNIGSWTSCETEELTEYSMIIKAK